LLHRFSPYYESMRLLYHAGRSVVGSKRRLTRQRLLNLRARRGDALIRIPTALISDEYAFSLGAKGWHYFRSLVAEYEHDPTVELDETVFVEFFQHPEIRSVRYLDDLLFLHDASMRAWDGHKFYLGTYPWGDWKHDHANHGGKPFGFYYDEVENTNTRDLYGYQRNPWYRPGDLYPLQIEWHHTLALYKSMKKGYQPARYGSFPSVVVLLRTDGEMRAVRDEGHHRLCLLAHFGHEKVTVALEPESVQVVDEREVEEWYYVKRGVCPPERALAIFYAFFEQDGSERVDYLGIPRAY
jgi:hypothetical protein